MTLSKIRYPPARQAFERESACRAESQLRKHGSDDRESCRRPNVGERGSAPKGGRHSAKSLKSSATALLVKCPSVHLSTAR